MPLSYLLACLALSAYLFCTVLTSPCLGGGILHVFPPSFQDQTFAVARPTVLLSRTVVTVSESTVEFRIDQTFLNDNEFPVDGLFILPLDSDGPIVTPEVMIDGISSSASVISWEEFFPLLRDLTVSMSDPSLVGLAGRDVLIVRPVSIGIREQKTFRIQYSRPLSICDDHLMLSVPLDGERYSLGPVGILEVLVRFKMSRTVRSILSTSHHVSVLRETPYRCLVTAKGSGKRVRDDFRLMVTFSGKDLNFRIFCHRSPGSPGFFMAFVEPPLPASRGEEPRDKDVVLVLDCSGSMGQKGFELAKAAALSALDKLGSGDRFNVIAVGTHPVPLANGLVSASAQNVAEAVRFVTSRKSEGGTDLYNGLMEAMDCFTTQSRPSLIVLVSDGRSTVGITKPETLVEDLGGHNRTKARIFVLAVGEGADIPLLDKLAVSTKGTSVHLAGTDDFEAAIGRLFSGVSPAKVSDVSIESENLSLKEVVPSPVPDIVGMESAVILGRYDHKGDRISKVRFRGKVEGRQMVVTRSVMFPDATAEYPDLPGMWAMRRMSQLLERAPLQGRDADSRQQIEDVATQYGFGIPSSLRPTAASSRSPDSTTDSGRLLWNYRRSFIISEVTSNTCRCLADKVFCHDNSRWIDSDYRPVTPARTIPFLSDEYFSLLKKWPSLGKYLALGPHVTIVHEKQAIHVTGMR